MSPSPSASVCSLFHTYLFLSLPLPFRILDFDSVLYNTCRKSATMGLNTQDSGESYLQSSQCLGVHHLGSFTHVAPMPSSKSTGVTPVPRL